MRILFQHNSEEGAAGGEHQLVRSDNIAVTNQGYIQEVIIVPDVGEGGGDVGVEVIPAEAELFCGHAGGGGGGGAGHDGPPCDQVQGYCKVRVAFSVCQEHL